MLGGILSLLLAVGVHFYSPTENDFSVLGNFGEMQGERFHKGIDIDTDGKEGKRVVAVGDGYVSRITLGYEGLDNAVYITHPEGYTSVYRNLSRFSPRLAWLLRKWQYGRKSYKADVRLRNTDCPVAIGQLIGLSGKDAVTHVPCLHLEMYDTKTWNLLDPLDFLSEFVRDGIPPIARYIMVYPFENEGCFCGKYEMQAYEVPGTNMYNSFWAWGKVGFGVSANDLMENSMEDYGVKVVELRVDDKPVFRCDFSKISPYIRGNCGHLFDAAEYQRSDRWFMRLFVGKGTSLPFIWTDRSKGVVHFNQVRNYHFTYTLTDFNGNTSYYTFIVSGKRAKLAERKEHNRNSRFLMKCDKTNTFTLPGMQLVLPRRMLEDDITLSPSVSRTENALSYSYSFGNRASLFGQAELNIALRGRVEDASKLYISGKKDCNRYLGGRCKNGWVTANIWDLDDEYCLRYDGDPPAIQLHNPSNPCMGNRFTVSISDGQSGVKSYQAYIDGEFVLLEDAGGKGLLTCNLNESPIRRNGRMRKLHITATDNRNNSSSFTANIKY